MRPSHTYQLVTILEGGKLVHLRCPTCGKEVTRTLPEPEATHSDGYKVVRDEGGALLSGDFYATHSWSMNMALSLPGVI